MSRTLEENRHRRMVERWCRTDVAARKHLQRALRNDPHLKEYLYGLPVNMLKDICFPDYTPEQWDEIPQ